MFSVTALLLAEFIASGSGQVLTRSVDVACPGQEVVFRCVDPGYRVIWMIRIGQTASRQVIFDRTSINQVEIINEPSPLMARLVNLGVHNASQIVSEVFVTASLTLSGMEITCSGIADDTDSLAVAALLPPPSNFRELYHHLISNSSIVVLSWDTLATSQLHHNILNSFHVSIPSLGVNVSTTEPVVSLLLPNFSANISFLLSSCNCVGCGNPATLTWSNTALDYATCYVPQGVEVSIECDQDLYPSRAAGNTSSMTFLCSASAQTPRTTTQAESTTALVNTACPGSCRSLSPGIAAVMTLTVLCSLVLVVIVVVQTCCILRLKRKTLPRRMRAVNGVLEHTESVKYSEPPATLGPLPPTPNALYNVVKNQGTVSKIDLNENDAYTYNSSDYYT